MTEPNYNRSDDVVWQCTVCGEAHDDRPETCRDCAGQEFKRVEYY